MLFAGQRMNIYIINVSQKKQKAVRQNMHDASIFVFWMQNRMKNILIVILSNIYKELKDNEQTSELILFINQMGGD